MAKMTSRATAAGTPVSIKLAGEEHKMNPLTLADHAEFERFLQQRVLDMAERMITDDMSQAQQDRIMDAAFRRAEKTSMQSPEGLAVANSLEGVSRLLWMGLREHHPEMTPEDVQKLLVDERTIRHAMNAFDLANDRRAAKKKPAKKAAKRKPRKSRSR